MDSDKLNRMMSNLIREEDRLTAVYFAQPILIELRQKIVEMEPYSPSWNTVVFREDVLDLLDRVINE